MKRQLKKLLSLMLVIVVAIPATTLFAAKVPFVNTMKLRHSDKSNPRISYTAGLAYYDIWRHADGTWQGGVAPNSVTNVPVNYQYDSLGGNVIDVKVHEYDPSIEWHNEVWDATRVQKPYYSDVERTIPTMISLGTPSITGTNTPNVSISLNINSKLDATEPKMLPTEGLDPGVIGMRYYLPLIIEVELEPPDHKVIMSFSLARRIMRN